MSQAEVSRDLGVRPDAPHLSIGGLLESYSPSGDITLLLGGTEVLVHYDHDDGGIAFGPECNRCEASEYEVDSDIRTVLRAIADHGWRLVQKGEQVFALDGLYCGSCYRSVLGDLERIDVISKELSLPNPRVLASDLERAWFQGKDEAMSDLLREVCTYLRAQKWVIVALKGGDVAVIQKGLDIQVSIRDYDAVSVSGPEHEYDEDGDCYYERH